MNAGVRAGVRALSAALLIGAPGASAIAQGVAPNEPPTVVRAGVTVTPDTGTVGGPFVVKVRVQAPPGATIVFPAGPDTAATVAARDPRRLDTIPAPNGTVDVVATYRLSAWDVGPQPLQLGDVTVRDGAAERRVPLSTDRVFVRTVLPADTALRVPKPPRAPVVDVSSVLVQWWPWLVAAAVVLTLVGWLLARWWHRRRNRRPTDDPYARALAELDRLARLGLIEAGESGRLVALAADAVRDYLAARLPEASVSLTSSELLSVLAERAEVPRERLDTFLAHADLVKFAALGVGADAARTALAEARGIVDDTERGIKEREAREAAERAERERRARDDVRRYEEERRRAAGREAA